tara:strand:- start:89 stop:373 length:285 start_codon:yes stop_codon:yes gene_type:complete
MNATKSLVEFLGTYIALSAILYTSKNYPKYAPIVDATSFAFVIFLFSTISANFNPAITLMMVIEQKQPFHDIFTLIIPQLLGGYLAYLTNKFIK